MNIKNTDKIDALQEDAESVILPEDYDGGDLFSGTGKQADDDMKQSAEEGEKQNEVEKTAVDEVQMSENMQQDTGFRREIATLLEQYPDLREKLAKGEGLPGEIISDCLKNGTGLCAAYAGYEERKAKAEAEQMRRENEILKQNSASAAKAPVRGTAAGCSIRNEGKDPFLEGLLSDN